MGFLKNLLKTGMVVILIFPVLTYFLSPGDVCAFQDANGRNTLFVFPPSTGTCCLDRLMKSQLVALGYNVKDEPVFHDGVISGTGFFISGNGLLVTNSHVIEDAKSIYLRKLDGAMLEAKVLINDPVSDVAVLAPIHETRVNNYLILGKFDRETVGNLIVVLGYPYPKVFKDPKLSIGIICATTGLNNNPEGFEISAPIQPGSSGSPVLNQEKEVIGIVNEQFLGMRVLKGTEQLPPDQNYGIKIEGARRLLDNHAIPYRKDVSSNPVSMPQLMDATALVLVNTREPVSNIQVPQKGRVVLVDFAAVWTFDLINYTVIELHECGANRLTPELIMTGSISGSHFESPQTVSNVAVKTIVKRINSFYLSASYP